MCVCVGGGGGGGAPPPPHEQQHSSVRAVARAHASTRAYARGKQASLGQQLQGSRRTNQGLRGRRQRATSTGIKEAPSMQEQQVGDGANVCLW
jgi:hypothetical protein